MELTWSIGVRTMMRRLEHINVKITFLLGLTHSNLLILILGQIVTQLATKFFFFYLKVSNFKLTNKTLVFCKNSILARSLHSNKILAARRHTNIFSKVHTSPFYTFYENSFKASILPQLRIIA